MADTFIVKKLEEYADYENLSRSQYNRRCIDNTIVGCSRCVGYCQYDGHPGFLTEKHRKKHNCIGKGCHYYLAKPERKRGTLSQMLSDTSSVILSLTHELLAEEEFVRVIKVENTAVNRYTASYVTITSECDFSGCISKIRRELGMEVDFVKLNYDFDKCVALLCAG